MVMMEKMMAMILPPDENESKRQISGSTTPAGEARQRQSLPADYDDLMGAHVVDVVEYDNIEGSSAPTNPT